MTSTTRPGQVRAAKGTGDARLHGGGVFRRRLVQPETTQVDVILDVIEISTPNLFVALAVTTAAGLATGFGSLLVFAPKKPNAERSLSAWRSPPAQWSMCRCRRSSTKSIPSFTQGYGDNYGFTYGTLAFVAGVGLIMLIDHLVPNAHECLDVDDPFFREHKHRLHQARGPADRAGDHCP